MRNDDTIRLPLSEDTDSTRRYRAGLPPERSARRTSEVPRRAPQRTPSPRREGPRESARPHQAPPRQAPPRREPVRRPPAEPPRPPAEPPRAAPPRRKRRKRRGCGCFGFILFWLVLLIACGVGYWFFAKSQVPAPIDSLPVSAQREEALRRAESNVHILLAGDDERSADEAARSDTIMMMVLRPVDKKIGLVAFPRDSLVEIPGQGEDKINAALAYGGIDLLESTVERLTKTPTDHYILVNFETFKKVVDAIGGVQINVPEKMYLPEEHIDLEAGDQLLDGYQALAFVRWRGDGQGDIGRMQRQHVFMEALMAKCRRLMPWQAARLAYVLEKEVKTDLTPADEAMLVLRMAGLDKDALVFEHFQLDPQYINGISYVLLDRADVRAVMNRLNYGVDIDELP